jgi:hypothetical protein
MGNRLLALLIVPILAGLTLAQTIDYYVCLSLLLQIPYPKLIHLPQAVAVVYSCVAPYDFWGVIKFNQTVIDGKPGNLSIKSNETFPASDKPRGMHVQCVEHDFLLHSSSHIRIDSDSLVQ